MRDLGTMYEFVERRSKARLETLRDYDPHVREEIHQLINLLAADGQTVEDVLLKALERITELEGHTGCNTDAINRVRDRVKDLETRADLLTEILDSLGGRMQTIERGSVQAPVPTITRMIDSLDQRVKLLEDSKDTTKVRLRGLEQRECKRAAYIDKMLQQLEELEKDITCIGDKLTFERLDNIVWSTAYQPYCGERRKGSPADEECAAIAEDIVGTLRSCEQTITKDNIVPENADECVVCGSGTNNLFIRDVFVRIGGLEVWQFVEGVNVCGYCLNLKHEDYKFLD